MPPSSVSAWSREELRSARREEELDLRLFGPAGRGPQRERSRSPRREQMGHKGGKAQGKGGPPKGKGKGKGKAGGKADAAP